MKDHQSLKMLLEIRVEFTLKLVILSGSFEIFIPKTFGFLNSGFTRKFSRPTVRRLFIVWCVPVLPSILLSTALCRSGFCRASRFLSSLAHTMKAFMGLRILCSPPAAFPSPEPADAPPAWVKSGLCPPELGVREILASALLMLPLPRPSGELQSPERLCSKPISESEAGLGVLDAQGPPRDTRPACRRVSLDKLGSVKFIPQPGLDSTSFFSLSLFFFLFSFF